MSTSNDSTKLQAAYDAEAFRQAGHQLIDLLADHLAQVQNADTAQPLIHYQDPEAAYEYWQNDLAHRQGSPTDWFADVLQRSIHLHHPQYMGHQISVPVPVTALAGMVSDMLSNGTGVYEMGMVSNALERVIAEFTARNIGYPTTAGGFLTSGGTLANLTALLAARAAKAPGNIWETGQGDQLAIMVSKEAHYCVDRAVRVMGWGAAGIVKIPTDEHFRIRAEALAGAHAKATAEGKTVIAVVGCAGSTATGSYDDLNALADYCAAHELWLHVDGAHGGAAVFSEQYRSLVSGLERADSVVIDFHKMLLTPALNTGLFYKDGRHAYQAFAQKAQYLWDAQETPEWYHSGKRTFECTKLMMALKVYASLRTYGPELWAANVDGLYHQARAFAQLIQAQSDFELAVVPESNIVNFRFLGGTGDTDLVNSQIRAKLVEQGNFYIVQTTIDHKRWLRVSIMNPHTDIRHFQALLDACRAAANR